MQGIETTGAALAAHYKRMADQGVLKKNTAHALRSAAIQVLSCQDGWEGQDLRTIDIDEAFRRFTNKRHDRVTPQSLEAYKRRFAQAVTGFLEYANDPVGWKPQARPRRPGHEAKPLAATVSTGTQGGVRAPSMPSAAPAGLMEFSYPLPPDRVAYLRLPTDLRTADVRRLTAFLATLAVDFEPGGE